MKSHDFAKQLSIMVKVLRSGPNIELDDLDYSEVLHLGQNKEEINQTDVPKALSMLAGLNQISKKQWLLLIEDYGFDVSTRAKDSAKDILSKLLQYLSKNPQDIHRLTGKKMTKTASSSAELADALSILLN